MFFSTILRQADGASSMVFVTRVTWAQREASAAQVDGLRMGEGW